MQANLRSFHTSRNLLEMCAAVRKSKLLLAQEIWAEKESITLRDFHPPLIKSRVNKEGGGVAIFVHKTVKWVQLTKYDTAGLEAVWAEVEIGNNRAVIGSVYIPRGQIKQIELLRNQLRVICDENSTVIVGMDANARHPLWDSESQQASVVSKQMGQRLADLLAENEMEILNDGSHTYHKGQYSSALDVTAVKGLNSEMNTTWKVVEDDIRSDHSLIEFSIGENPEVERKTVKDWKTFSWPKYQKTTEKVLNTLIEKWQNEQTNALDMAQQLTDALTEVADELLSEKSICKHSKPWTDTEIIEKLREQRAAKKNWKRRRSPRNYEKYTELVDQTEKIISEAKDRWWTAEIKRLEEAPQEKKWKILDRITNPQLRMGIQPVKVDGSYVFSDEEILEQMEKVHVRKGDCSNDVNEDLVNNLQLDIETARNQCIEDDDDDLHNTMITIDEVESTFGKCSNTAGSDGITAAMIDNAHREKMTECLHFLWNSIWTENKIPAQWKLENRKLIPKAGKDSYNECEAYRTVSITALLGKRLEKIISARLTCCLESQEFDENQFAYLKGRSSTQAVLKLVEEAK